METIIKRYEEKFGYTPSISELYNLYAQGLLRLSDNEENALKIEFENYHRRTSPTK